MANITLNALTKSYDGTTKVLQQVDGAITDGEFIVIVGPSGCGKSTLLRMVAGLESVTTGDIEIGGKRVNDLEPADRDIAMVFQNYALYPHMSVRQNMAYGLKIRKMPKDEINRKVEAAADILEISAYLDRKPRQLSGGQRQRVAMGRAIVRDQRPGRAAGWPDRVSLRPPERRGGLRAARRRRRGTPRTNRATKSSPGRSLNAWSHPHSASGPYKPCSPLTTRSGTRWTRSSTSSAPRRHWC